MPHDPVRSALEYQTRRNQIAGFLRRLKLPTEYRVAVRDALRDAAMVGACEERSRTLNILRRDPDAKEASEEIIKRSVLAVLGYEP